MTREPGDFHAVATLADLADGDVVAAEVDGIEIVVFRVGADVCATQRRCPHQGADLVDGLVLDGGILCGVHGWRFDGVSGLHDSSPTCLATYPVRLRGDTVEVCGIRRPPLHDPDPSR